MVALSIVIVNYNVKGFLQQCLDSIYRSVTQYTFEVIVVDNASSDQSAALLRPLFPQVQWVQNQENVGFGRANNQGFALAKGTYTLILNPDTVLREDTLEVSLNYLRTHPEVGGLGIKGLDGHGQFLPESKRGLPTPWVALSKLSGLAKLFPKSKLFARYYLGHLDPNANQKVEILVGCYMMVPTDLLLKVGGFDERYFMYGEDIDLSYELLKTGAENHYLADSHIIHYKGESTKRGSMNYVRMFYKAMVLFAQKQFSGTSAATYTLLIYLGIYLRAGLAVLSRAFTRAAAPLVDAVVLAITLEWLKTYWELNHRFVFGGSYPDFYTYVVQGSYLTIWLFGLWAAGVYSTHARARVLVGAMATTTVLLGFVYGLLPETLRYSRALLLLSALGGTAVLLIWRTLLGALTGRSVFRDPVKGRRILFIGSATENDTTLQLLREYGLIPDLFHTLPLAYARGEADPDDLLKITALCRSLDLTEVIVDSRSVSNWALMDIMQAVPAQTSVKTLLGPNGPIIGSDSSFTQGDVYQGERYATANPNYLRQKRLADILLTLGVWLLLPFSIALAVAFRRPKTLWAWLRSSGALMRGTATLVGYEARWAEEFSLPQLPAPVFSITSTLPKKMRDTQMLQLVCTNYAKTASFRADLLTMRHR